MKSLLTATLTLAIASSPLFAQTKNEKKEEKKEAAPAAAAASSDLFKGKYDKASYAIGMDMANSARRIATETGIALNFDLIVKGLGDTLNDKSALSEEQVAEALTTLQKELQEKQVSELKALAEKNAAASDKFLEENKKKEGVKTTESGLQYKVITEGKGAKPTKEDTVAVKYKGTLIDGTEFDNSERHGGPVTFGVGEIIPGWTEALQLMPVGSKWQLVIPSSLAYGEMAPPQIGPNQALIFEVELVEIKKDDKKDEKKDEQPAEKK